MKKNLIIATLVVLLTFSACTWIPTITSKSVKTVKIGVITSNIPGFETNFPLFEAIIQPDINDYVAKLPRKRFSPRIKFEFLVESAEGSADVHLKKVKMFHEMGVDIVIGGFWSSQAMGSLSYMDENDMLLISPSSTAPALAIADDNLFRLFPDDTAQSVAIAEMVTKLWS